MGIEAAIIGGGLGLIGANQAARGARAAASTQAAATEAASADAAQAQVDAARIAARAQMDAARLAAEEARFRPVGIRTGFGTSQFGFDPQGRLTSAGYTLSPELQAQQQQLLGLSGGALSQAQLAAQQVQPLQTAASGLFGLGQQLLPTSLSRAADPQALAMAERLGALGRGITPSAYDPQAAAQQYFEEQQALLEPGRAREEQRLGRSVFGRGRLGLSVGDMGQPELFALSQARAEQDLALAAQARERARAELQQDIGIGTGLEAQALAGRQTAEDLARARFAEDVGLGTGLFGQGLDFLTQIPQYQVAALAPYQAYLGGAQQLEALGQQPLDIGASLGGRNTAAAQALLQGGMGAAQTIYQGATGAANTQLQAALSGAQQRAQAGMVGPALFGQTVANLGNQYFQQQQNQQLLNALTFNRLGGTTGTGGFTYYGSP